MTLRLSFQGAMGSGQLAEWFHRPYRNLTVLIKVTDLQGPYKKIVSGRDQ